MVVVPWATATMATSINIGVKEVATWMYSSTVSPTCLQHTLSL